MSSRTLQCLNFLILLKRNDNDSKRRSRRGRRRRRQDGRVTKQPPKTKGIEIVMNKHERIERRSHSHFRRVVQMPAVPVIHFDGILAVSCVYAPGVARTSRAMHEADVVPLLRLFE